MSEERTLEKVTQEHNQLVFEIGLLDYRMAIEAEEKINKMNRVKELNQEAHQINEANKKAEELKKKDDSKPASTEIVSENTPKNLEAANGN